MSHEDDAQLLAARLLPSIRNLVRWLVRDNASQGLSRSAASTLSTLRDEGPQRITVLARMEHVSQPTMTGMVKRMSDAGWVARTVDDHDRRVAEISITEKGLAAIEAWVRESEHVLTARLASMTAEQRTQIAKAADALAELAAAD